jgi:DNA-binding SARP family transcriptional activator
MTELGLCAPRVDVLGQFALTLQDGTPARVARASQRLLAYLAVARGPVRRTLVAQRLWPDADSSHAASNLRSALWRLPRAHGAEVVTVSPTTVALSPHVRVDLWDSEFRARDLVRDDPSDDGPAGVPGLERDLLPDWSEEWLDIEQESYRQLRLHALEELSRRSCQQRRYAAALAAGLAAVRGEPLRESAHRCLITAHLAEGNPAEALRQFHAYRRLLARELGIAPSPAIRELVAPLLGRPLEGPPSRARGVRRPARGG